MSISGKPREQCINALRAAFGNPDRAFEFLMTGIPAGGQGAGAAGVEGAEAMDADADYGDEGSGVEGGAGAGGNPFAALASNPNFAMIR